MIHTDTHICTHTDTHLPTKQADPKKNYRDSWQSSRYFEMFIFWFFSFCIFHIHTLTNKTGRPWGLSRFLTEFSVFLFFSLPSSSLSFSREHLREFEPVCVCVCVCACVSVCVQLRVHDCVCCVCICAERFRELEKGSAYAHTHTYACTCTHTPCCSLCWGPRSLKFIQVCVSQIIQNHVVFTCNTWSRFTSARFYCVCNCLLPVCTDFGGG